MKNSVDLSGEVNPEGLARVQSEVRVEVKVEESPFVSSDVVSTLYTGNVIWKEKWP